MSLRLKTSVVLLMLALLPMRALAAVTIGFCAMHDHLAATPMFEHGASHEHDGVPHGDGSHEQCNACVEHCASASVVASPGLSLPTAALARRITAAEQLAAGFVPDQLDPPPLGMYGKIRVTGKPMADAGEHAHEAKPKHQHAAEMRGMYGA